jgi:hypothetical protein
MDRQRVAMLSHLGLERRVRGYCQGLRMKKSEDLESEIGIKGCAAALAT